MNAWLRDTVLHFRPRSWPVVIGHFGAGAALAVAHAPADARWQTTGFAVIGGAVWTVLLNGGTLAINSAYDRDSGDIGYLDNPPDPPDGLAGVALGAMALGCVVALALGTGYAAAYAACLLLSLLYSVPPVRLKAIAGADLLVNMAGYGGLTFAAGALVSPSHLSGGMLGAVLALATSFAFLFGAFYPMTQIYQVPEDRARGDNTLAIRVGPQRALRLSLIALMLCGALQLAAAGIAGVGFVGTVLLTAVNAGWAVFITGWLRGFSAYPHQSGMYRALKLWALSDLAVVVAFALFA